jgi:hypothetical protein
LTKENFQGCFQSVSFANPFSEKFGFLNKLIENIFSDFCQAIWQTVFLFYIFQKMTFTQGGFLKIILSKSFI